MEQQTYQIKTGAFEGPFGLLLDLVESRKLFINDVSLAAVTEDYLKYIKELGSSGQVHHGEVASFVLVASTLILIKSKSLLPNLNLTSEEEGDIRSLEERLRLYKLFTKLSLHLKSDFGKRIIFAPLERKAHDIVFLPDDQITAQSMMGFAGSVLGRIPKKIVLPEVEVRKVISIEEMIDKLTERIKSSLKMNFNEMTGKVSTREEKVTAIVGFLAMLELIRQGIIQAVQENHGEDIIMENLTS